jgi:hypothetical protein
MMKLEHAESVSEDWNVYIDGLGPGLKMLDLAHRLGYKNIQGLQTDIKKRFFRDCTYPNENRYKTVVVDFKGVCSCLNQKLP